MVDGAVRFVGEEIDAGNEHVPTVYLDSPTPPGSRSPVWSLGGDGHTVQQPVSELSTKAIDASWCRGQA